MKRNIGFLKLGKRVKLKEEHGIGNGDFDSRQLLKLLSLHFPDDQFHIIGDSDLSDLGLSEYREMFPNSNVSPFSNFIYQKGEKLDFSIVISGPVRPEVSDVQVEILNDFGGRIIEVSHDSRFSCVVFQNLWNQPRVSLGQANYTSFDSRSNRRIETRYAHQELLYLFEKKPNPIPEQFVNKFQSKRDLLVISMKDEDYYREDELTKFVFDSEPSLDYEVWGTYQPKDSTRWRGTYKYEDLPQVCEMYKAAFLVPISEAYATSKYVEMLHHNVIPLVHPDYDSQNNTLLKEFKGLRVCDEKDLQHKIEILSENPVLATGLLAEYKSRLMNLDFYTGKFLADIFRKEMNQDA